MPNCAVCGEWLSREYARVNGGNWNNVICSDCGGVVGEIKPEKYYRQYGDTSYHDIDAELQSYEEKQYLDRGDYDDLVIRQQQLDWE